MNNKITQSELDKIRELNPLGDPYLAKYDIENVIGKIDTKGNPIDFDYIYNKYKEYIIWHGAKFVSTDEKYISKENKLRNISQFLEQQMYIQEFKTGSKLDPRTNYIFGNINNVKTKYDEIYKNKSPNNI
jgi:hypothetical protein